nr:hypothetical protein [Streptomyces qaidamensis]
MGDADHRQQMVFADGADGDAPDEDEPLTERRRLIDLGMPTFSRIAPHFSTTTNPLSY